MASCHLYLRICRKEIDLYKPEKPHIIRKNSKNMLKIQEFHDKLTGTVTYVTSSGGKCAIIYPVMNYDQYSGKVSYESADEVIGFVKKEELELAWILETHIHADHMSGCEYIKGKAVAEGFGTSVESCIGENVTKVVDYWGKAFEFEGEELEKAGGFDRLLKDGEKITLGNEGIEVISTPGHTPCCVTYKIGDVAFVGDVIFAPDIGTARCDFPGGNASQSYASIQKIFAFGDDVKLYTGHDYPNGRDLEFFSTVKEQKAKNLLAGSGVTEDEFVEARTKKDAGLAAPKLLYPSLQVNIFAGKIDGKKFLKIPVGN